MEIHCQNLNFSYSTKPLIRNLNFTARSGESIWIKGLSGSGKSSFLRLLAGYLRPDSGTVSLGQTKIQDLSADEKQNFRLNNVGYIHQENHLIEHWTVQQNLELVGATQRQIDSFLLEVNLDSNIKSKLVCELSGGEKQRLCIIRLLIQKPRLALLDEPTSHLDDRNTEQMLKLIKFHLSESTLVIVSHDSRLEAYFNKTINFSDLNK